jgi:hypothetical protein
MFDMLLRLFFGSESSDDSKRKDGTIIVGKVYEQNGEVPLWK